MDLIYQGDDDLEFIPEDPTNEFLTADTGELIKFSSSEISMKLLNFICTKCNINCGSQNMWKEHMYARHNFPRATSRNIGSIACKLCSFSYSEKQDIDRLYHHFPKHMPKKHYVLCTLCKLGFNSPLDGEYHICSYHLICRTKSCSKFSTKICNVCEELMLEEIIGNLMAVCKKCKQIFVIQ